MSLKILNESLLRLQASEGVTELSLRDKRPKLEKKLFLFLSVLVPRLLLSYSTRLGRTRESTRSFTFESMKFPLFSKIFNKDFSPFFFFEGLSGSDFPGLMRQSRVEILEKEFFR